MMRQSRDKSMPDSEQDLDLISGYCMSWDGHVSFTGNACMKPSMIALLAVSLRPATRAQSLMLALRSLSYTMGQEL